MNLRTATLKDLNELLFIEEQAHHYPWSESTLRWCIEQPHIQCFILQKERELIGFAIYESVIDEATLLNIAVHPFMQGKGFGKQLFCLLYTSSARLGQSDLVHTLPQ